MNTIQPASNELIEPASCRLSPEQDIDDLPTTHTLERVGLGAAEGRDPLRARLLPLTGLTAEKLDFPSGGLRNTFEARGYTGWDVTSPGCQSRTMQQSGRESSAVTTEVAVAVTVLRPVWRLPMMVEC